MRRGSVVMTGKETHLPPILSLSKRNWCCTVRRVGCMWGRVSRRGRGRCGGRRGRTSAGGMQGQGVSRVRRISSSTRDWRRERRPASLL